MTDGTSGAGGGGGDAGEDKPEKCPKCGAEHPADRNAKAKAKGEKALKNARKKFGNEVKDGAHLDKHKMPTNVINDTVSNPSAVFYDRNNGNLIFFKEGNVTVTDKTDMSSGITAFGKDDKDGVAVDKDNLDKGKKQCKVVQIE